MQGSNAHRSWRWWHVQSTARVALLQVPPLGCSGLGGNKQTCLWTSSPAVQQAIFPGDSELQQLLHIFKLLGTPSEEVWPGVTRLRDWHEFPQWHPQDLSRVRCRAGRNGHTCCPAAVQEFAPGGPQPLLCKRGSTRWLPVCWCGLSWPDQCRSPRPAPAGLPAAVP